jgi:predicted nucleotidyltransferase
MIRYNKRYSAEAIKRIMINLLVHFENDYMKRWDKIQAKDKRRRVNGKNPCLLEMCM